MTAPTRRNSALLLALCLLLAVAVCPPANAQGAGGNYRVEVIIFRSVAPLGSEDFSAPPEGRGFDGRLDAGGTPPKLVRLLDAADLQLSGMAAQLRGNAAYRVLAHAGWVQTATPWRRHVGLSLETLGITAPGLRGTLYLERGDYLHFGADLRLGENPAYALSELRRVKFNERHYLDNPAFGVIVQVSQAR